MKAVLMSIRPTWAQLIDKGLKTVEVRKSIPLKAMFRLDRKEDAE